MNHYLFFATLLLHYAKSSDITQLVFGTVTDGMPAAFGDFNSDELTDVFVLRGTGSVEILLAFEEEPLLRPGPGLRCNFNDTIITSVVPGDYDGDAFMDILVTGLSKRKNEQGKILTEVYIIWGGIDHINCTNKPTLKMIGEPLALDYNQDMIIDLFGMDESQNRAFWIFNKNRTTPTYIKMSSDRKDSKLREPHSHAFLDLNNDFTPDLFITTERNFEVWYGNEEKKDIIDVINLPDMAKRIGQSIFVDIRLTGMLDLITPVCYDDKCLNCSILVYSNKQWNDLKVDFKDSDHNVWGFVVPDGKKYTDTITLHSGDFNMDGYPDILATLQTASIREPQSFFLENVPCETNCGEFNRTYEVRWKALNPFNNGTILAVFYDFYQDGILDLILVQRNSKATAPYSVGAFRNTLDYDANFLKVMVLTGLTNPRYPFVTGRLGRKKRTYGTNLPGPIISYRTITQEGNSRCAASAQLPQSAHFSLNLPYTIFGLGRTPNFVDSLTVGLSNRSREWTQIIPNSQMVVIPWPPDQPSKWKAQLFVTPSKLILMSVAALTGVCGLITLIILALYWRERQEDRKERLSESHRFHFDAM